MKWPRLLLLVWLGGFLAACAQGAAPATTPVGERATLTARTMVPSASPTALPTASPLPATATVTPAPTLPPPPPLTRPLYPADWVADPHYGAPDASALAVRVGRGYVSTAALHPMEDLIALARLRGVYLCPLPTAAQGPQPLACSTYLPHDAVVFRLAFSPDGRWLATLDTHAVVRLWDWQHPDAPPQVFRPVPDTWDLYDEDLPLRAGALSFSADGRYLAAAADRLVVWDLNTGQEVPLGEPLNVPVDDPDALAKRRWWVGVAFDAGPTLLAGTAQGHLALVDVTRPQETARFLAFQHRDMHQRGAPVSNLTWVPALGHWLAIEEGYQPTALLISPQGSVQPVQAAAPPEAYNDPNYEVGSDATVRAVWPALLGPFSAKGDLVIVPREDGNLLAYNLPAMTFAYGIKPPKPPFNWAVFAAFAPTDERIIAVWGNGAVAVWSATDHQVLGFAPGDAPRFTGVAFRPQQPAFYSASDRGAAAPIWHPDTGQIEFLGGGTRAAFSPDGCYRINYRLRPSQELEMYALCQPLAGQEEAMIPQPEVAISTAHLPGGDYFVPPAFLDPYPWVALVPDEYNTPPYVVSLEDGQVVYTLEAPQMGGAFSLAAAPTEHRLYQGGRNRVAVWNLDTGQLEAVWTFEAPLTGSFPNVESKVLSLAFEPITHRLAAGRYDGQIAFWDTRDGTLLRVVDVDALVSERTGWDTQMHPTLMTFARGGRYLLVYGDGEFKAFVMVLDAETGDLVGRIPMAAGWHEDHFALSPDERFVGTGGAEASLAVWHFPLLLDGETDKGWLPLPLSPASLQQPEPAAYHTRYTMTLSIADGSHTLLDVRTAGRKDTDPPRRRFLFQGEGIPIRGEGLWSAQGWLNMGAYLLRPSDQAPWQLSLGAERIPPAEPWLRPWDWQAEGFDGEAYRYRSQSLASAPLPPQAWVSRALGAWAVFHPQSFQGEVRLRSDGLLLEASLAWEGTLETQSGPQPARLEAHYRLEDFQAEEINLPQDQDVHVAGFQGTGEHTFVEGIPLYPGALESEEPGEQGSKTYVVKGVSAKTILAWYQEQLPRYGIQILHVESQGFSFMGLQFNVYILSLEKEGRPYVLSIADGGMFTQLIIAAGP